MKKQSWWVGIRIPGHSRWRMVAANEFTDQWWPRFHSLMVSSLAKKSATMNSLVLVKFSFWTNSAPMNSLVLVKFSFWNTYWTVASKEDQLHKDEWNVF